MTEEEFAEWWEQCEELQEGGASFFDVLRRDLARRLQIRNFRQLALACGEGTLGPDSAWMHAEIVVVVRQYLEICGEEQSYHLAELFQAGGSGNTSQVVCLLEVPMDPESSQEGRPGRTVLHEASKNGHAEVVRCLLDSGADKDSVTGDTWRTPMHVAARNGRQQVVSCLLEARADKDRTDLRGKTPVLLASERGHPEVVRCLVEAGADHGKASCDGLLTPAFVCSCLSRTPGSCVLLAQRWC